MITVKTCYFNETFNVYLYTDRTEQPVKVKETIRNLSEGRFRLTEYTKCGLTYYTFGLLTHDERKRPGHKGEWSSNEHTVKELFDLDLIGVGLDGLAVSIKHDDLLNLVNLDVYYINKEERYLCGLSSDAIEQPEYMGWYDKDGNIIPIA